MKKLFIATAFLFFTSLWSNAQSYDTGIGVRGGLASGITGKHFLSENAAVEGILSTRWRGFSITGLYEIHAIAFDTPGLYWFYGFGGHLGFWDGYAKHPWFDDAENYAVFGIDGIIGMEYVFADIPFTIGIDWKPAINISGHSGFWVDSAGLSVRYIF